MRRCVLDEMRIKIEEAKEKKIEVPKMLMQYLNHIPKSSSMDIRNDLSKALKYVYSLDLSDRPSDAQLSKFIVTIAKDPAISFDISTHSCHDNLTPPHHCIQLYIAAKALHEKRAEYKTQCGVSNTLGPHTDLKAITRALWILNDHTPPTPEDVAQLAALKKAINDGTLTGNRLVSALDYVLSPLRTDPNAYANTVIAGIPLVFAK